jgi:hypothetical protein
MMSMLKLSVRWFRNALNCSGVWVTCGLCRHPCTVFMMRQLSSGWPPMGWHRWCQRCYFVFIFNSAAAGSTDVTDESQIWYWPPSDRWLIAACNSEALLGTFCPFLFPIQDQIRNEIYSYSSWKLNAASSSKVTEIFLAWQTLRR